MINVKHGKSFFLKATNENKDREKPPNLLNCCKDSFCLETDFAIHKN